MTREEIKAKVAEVVASYAIATTFATKIMGFDEDAINTGAVLPAEDILKIIDGAEEPDLPEDTEFCEDGFVSTVHSEEDFKKLMKVLFN